ncbi:MAG: TonB-dependent receptor [Tannerella sp.]|jgi:TonB-linked SusC/RagA family outer membrane protein|nr:TonB-dependent receptor [Tannerella sp.]
MKKLKERIFCKASRSGRNRGLLLTQGFLFLWLIFSGLPVLAQNTQTVRGNVVDQNGEPLPGVSVVLKNTTNGVMTNADGNFVLTVPAGRQTLQVSFIGMLTQDVIVSGTSPVNVVLREDAQQLEEVVVVGYGQQAKASVVAAITQIGATELERTGGVASLGRALTGYLPGVVAYTSTGMPGDDDPRIVIRAQTSWNHSEPLVLVDGIERPMNTVDIASVQNISVLKDASATAVYGVKGANGVILITTKRGQEGKAQVQVRANSTMKVVSKLPEKYDAYDTYILKNSVLERQLAISPGSWDEYMPMETIGKFRNPLTPDEWDRYPNVDWEAELFKRTAMAYNLSTNVSGGTSLVKYFAALDYHNEGDLFKEFKNDRGYQSTFSFNRLNVRSNLDFDLTKTTQFSTNLFGSYGVRTRPWDAFGDPNSYWRSAYRTAPDAMRPVYSDGHYGYYAPRDADVPNSVAFMTVGGLQQRTTTQITTDFVLRQNLDMITKGLSARADISLDNRFLEQDRGINDLYNYQHRKYVYTDGSVSWREGEDFSEQIRWQVQNGNINTSQTYRRVYYSARLNYERTFGLHNVTALGLFSRERLATGSEFPHYREDWVYRATYNYAMKYLLEFNGAYNGSEKFGPDYRFAFFPSFSGGWTISEESFMKGIGFLDMLKIRASWGKIGDDEVSGRFLYQDQWQFSGNARMGNFPANTPYTFYRTTTIGNLDVSWETVEKQNLGFDFAFLQNFVAGSFDLFKDHRTDIMITGNDRAVPSFYTGFVSTANLGEVKSKGYELELRLNYVFENRMRLWLTGSMTHAINEVLFRDDPELTPAYQKQAGYKMGQTREFIDQGFLQSWDDVYGSTPREGNNLLKIAGDYNIIDFNSDGVINDNDRAPYQYSGVPDNTYNLSLGWSWKEFSAFVQFYGVNNVSRLVDFSTFHSNSNVAYHEGAYWTKDGGGDIPVPRWGVSPTGQNGTRFWYDGSYLRLRNAEIAYTLSSDMAKKLNMKGCKIFLNGENLFLWSKMPDDRENNFSSNGSGGDGAYPTVRRFNLGIDITF